MAQLNVDITTSVTLRLSSIVNLPALSDIGGSGLSALDITIEEATSIYLTDRIFNKVFADRAINDPIPATMATTEEHLFMAYLVSYKLCHTAMDLLKNGGIKKAKADVVETEFFANSFNSVQVLCNSIAGELSRLACKLGIDDYCGINDSSLFGDIPGPIIVKND